MVFSKSYIHCKRACGRELLSTVIHGAPNNTISEELLTFDACEGLVMKQYEGKVSLILFQEKSSETQAMVILIGNHDNLLYETIKF